MLLSPDAQTDRQTDASTVAGLLEHQRSAWEEANGRKLPRESAELFSLLSNQSRCNDVYHARRSLASRRRLCCKDDGVICSTLHKLCVENLPCMRQLCQHPSRRCMERCMENARKNAVHLLQVRLIRYRFSFLRTCSTSRVAKSVGPFDFLGAPSASRIHLPDRACSEEASTAQECWKASGPQPWSAPAAHEHAAGRVTPHTHLDDADARDSKRASSHRAHILAVLMDFRRLAAVTARSQLHMGALICMHASAH